eukprot:COSAG01_NODE_81_length_27820_cov_22.659753_20_plen_135_part_00
MISAEAPILFAKACEMFILELTLRSWYQTEEFKRRTLQVRRWSGVSLTRLAANRYNISSMPPVCCCCQRSDVSAAIRDTEIFDFLEDAVPDDKQVRWSASWRCAMAGAGLVDAVAAAIAAAATVARAGGGRGGS